MSSSVFPDPAGAWMRNDRVGSSTRRRSGASADSCRRRGLVVIAVSRVIVIKNRKLCNAAEGPEMATIACTPPLVRSAFWSDLGVANQQFAGKFLEFRKPAIHHRNELTVFFVAYLLAQDLLVRGDSHQSTLGHRNFGKRNPCYLMTLCTLCNRVNRKLRRVGSWYFPPFLGKLRAAGLVIENDVCAVRSALDSVDPTVQFETADLGRDLL